MHMWKALFTFCTLSSALLGAHCQPPSAGTFNVTLFSPPSSYIIPRVLYARSLLLEESNVLLATWENYSPEPPLVYFPIYRSTDLGRTWEHISNVTDTQNNWGLRYQPFLYELEEDIGEFAKGTILAAGNSIPTDLDGTKMDIYASTDKGYTWTFVSSIATGGKAVPNNGETPIWEPFILTWEHQIVLYYSDQRDPDHGQKLVHHVSSDLVNWGPITDDYASDVYADRPGMTTIAKLPNGQYIMTYEWNGSPYGGYASYYRLASDPTKFAEQTTGYPVRSTAEGIVPSSSPYVVWTPYGGVNGTIIVSGNSRSEIFVNTDLAAPGSPWRMVPTGAPRAYTRSLRVLPDPSELLILGAGTLGGSTNKVTAYVVDLDDLL